MFLTANGIKLYYERYDNGGVPTLLLHGWGCSCAVMHGLFEELKLGNKSVICLDLPYFGQSESPDESFGIYEYAETVFQFLKGLGIENCNLLGHSFGGRLCLILSADYGIGKKIILTGGAGLKPKKNIAKRIKILLFKLKKKLGFRPKNAGSSDYKLLPESMKPVFVRVVNQHLDKLLPKIAAPTLLLWGENDTETPPYMAKKMQRLIRDCGLVFIKDAGHYAFLDKPNEFYPVLNAFI